MIPYLLLLVSCLLCTAQGFEIRRLQRRNAELTQRNSYLMKECVKAITRTLIGRGAHVIGDPYCPPNEIYIVPMSAMPCGAKDLPS